MNLDAQAIIQRTLVPAIERAGFNAIPSSDKWSPTDNEALSFSNGEVRLDIYRSQQTGELSLTLEHPAPDHVGVPLARLFERNRDPDADWTAHGLILCSADRAEKALGRLSDAIDRNVLALAGLSAKDVIALYEDWLAASRVNARREDISRSIATAEALWHDGNYSECARLLAEIEPDLSPAQHKRLQLARRKTQSS